MTETFDISSLQGLSEEEAQRRLTADGYNELPQAKPRSVLAIAFEVVREPMFLLLIGSGAIYLFLGEVSDAAMLLGFVFVVMGITLYQERKTERALDALRDLTSPRALVIRDGRQNRIAGRDVVRGDVMMLAEGDRVPADAVLMWCNNLSVDESLLTGESVPVRKCNGEDTQSMEAPGGDDTPFVFSGTLVVAGQGIAQVLETAAATEIGKIGKALESVDDEETPLQRETGRLVMQLAAFGLSLCALVVIVYGLTRSDWVHGMLAGITLAMAMLPEEFPVVLTIFLALGAWRISRSRVLTRRMPAVETLGSATVLCVDKTGTLTQNEMSVARLFADEQFHDVTYATGREPLPERFHEVVEFSILASETDPFDPMEKAFRRFGDGYLADTEHLHDDWALVHEYPLSGQMLVEAHVWKSPDGNEYVIAAKGAPEAIGDLCHFDAGQLAHMHERVSSMAADGLRVLAVARANFELTDLPGQQHDFAYEYIGLVGLADPIRQTVPAAVAECYTAGVRVIMITGDYAVTAQHIARQIGLKDPDNIITGPELNDMDDEELARRIPDVNVFARVVPEQKLRLVNALKGNGEVVAMTGDGVNDAPALKAAHIGVAMGGRGTDVAREASALVLLDDDFSSIVKAVRMGRRIYDNLRKAIAYILAIHVPIAGLSLAPVLFGWPLVLLPVHVVFLELIIDPACSTVFEAEPEESDVMRRPPRDPRAPLFGRRTVTLAVLQGASVLLITLAVYAVALRLGSVVDEARAMTFTTLIVANLGLILANRSWSRVIVSTLRTPNRALWWVLGGAATMLGLVLYVPYLRKLFHFAPLSAQDLAICLVAGIVSIGWFEALKAIRGNRPGTDSLAK